MGSKQPTPAPPKPSKTRHAMIRWFEATRVTGSMETRVIPGLRNVLAIPHADGSLASLVVETNANTDVRAFAIGSRWRVRVAFPEAHNANIADDLVHDYGELVVAFNHPSGGYGLITSSKISFVPRPSLWTRLRRYFSPEAIAEDEARDVLKRVRDEAEYGDDLAEAIDEVLGPRPVPEFPAYEG